MIHCSQAAAVVACNAPGLPCIAGCSSCVVATCNLLCCALLCFSGSSLCMLMHVINSLLVQLPLGPTGLRATALVAYIGCAVINCTRLCWASLCMVFAACTHCTMSCSQVQSAMMLSAIVCLALLCYCYCNCRCQYDVMGVTRHNGRSLAPLGRLVWHEMLREPEGVTFAHGHMYVQVGYSV